MVWIGICFLGMVWIGICLIVMDSLLMCEPFMPSLPCLNKFLPSKFEIDNGYFYDWTIYINKRLTRLWVSNWLLFVYPTIFSKTTWLIFIIIVSFESQQTWDAESILICIIKNVVFWFIKTIKTNQYNSINFRVFVVIYSLDGSTFFIVTQNI